MLRRRIDARRIPLFGALVRSYQDRLTPRGRFLFWTLVALSVMGLDTVATLNFALFAAAFGFLLAAAPFSLRGRPRLRVAGALPSRATAGTDVPVRLELSADAAYPDLWVSLPRTAGVSLEPGGIACTAEPGRPAVVNAVLRAPRRGRYELGPARFSRTDPLGLGCTRAETTRPDALLVYPRFSVLERFDLPLGRRHQPGGVPLASSTGDSVEFIGTRDYREGDPVRSIHWSSWARRGRPVVKEHQEEYFCRIAIILDTFTAGRGADPAFEATVSAVASIADWFSRSEYLVDILAAGPDLYEVSAGRSLAYLETILDVLACLEPCSAPPFETIGPALFEKLGRVSTVVAVLQDWDPARRDFLRKVREAGTALRIVIVRKGPTSTDSAEAYELGRVDRLAPEDVEKALG